MYQILLKTCFVMLFLGLVNSCNPSQRIQIHPQAQYCHSQFVIRAKILRTTALYDYILRHCIEKDPSTTSDDLWTKLDATGGKYLDSRAKSCPLSKKYIKKFLNNLEELGITLDANEEQETYQEDWISSAVTEEEGDQLTEQGGKLIDRVFSKFGKYGENGPSVHLARIIYIYKGDEFLTTSKLVEIFSTDHTFDENGIYVLSGDIDSGTLPEFKYANVIRAKMFEGRLNVLNEHWAVKYPEITRQQFRGLKGIYASNCNCEVKELEEFEFYKQNKKKKNKKNKNKKRKSKLLPLQNTNNSLSTECVWVPSHSTCAYFFSSCIHTETEGCVWKRPRAFKSCERMFGKI